MSEPINIERIKNSIDRYPDLKKVMGNIKKITQIYNFPYKQNKQIVYEWNIFGILNLEDFNGDKKRILERINYLIKKLNRYYTSEQFKSGLINNPFSFLSELEFANYCIDSGYEIIETEPKLKTGKKLDLKVKINNQPVLVEVITPRLKLSMLQKQIGTFPISAEVENNIKREFEHHQIEINDIKEDFILVIDGDYAGIDLLNMKSALKEFYVKNPEKNKYLSGIYLKKGRSFCFINSISG